MNNLLAKIGGRKLALTLVSMVTGTSLAFFMPIAIVEPVLVFLAACLASFCASNWAASREYHKTKMPAQGDNPQVKQLIAENKKVLKKLDEILSSGDNGDEVAQAAMQQFQQLNEAMLTLGQTSGTTLQAVQQLNQKIQNLHNLRGG